MKKFIVLILCLVMSLSFVACVETDAEIGFADNPGERLVLVDRESGDYYIYVDRDTKVMYLFVKHGYGGGLTVMLDENGDPLLWEDTEENIEK